MSHLTHRTIRAALALPLAAAVAAAAAGPAAAAKPAHAKPARGAVFVQTDNPAGNSVVVYDRTATGTLRKAGTYATGGRGGVLGGSEVDHLASQGGLTYDRHAGMLYAVNAGSDSITAFAVRGDRLSHRQVLPSGGSFPASVTAHGGAVYVLNARGGGSLQGFRRTGSKLKAVPAWHRALGLDPNAMPEFTTTHGQVTFSPGGGALLVTTKGNTSAVQVFAVDRQGAVAARPVVTPLAGAAPFALTFDAAGRVALAEAGPNAVATLALGGDGTLTPVSSVPTGQMATCWIVAIGDTLYVSNAGSGTLSLVHDAPGGAPLTIAATTPTDAGTVDAAPTSDGRFLYVQAGKDGKVDAFRVGAGGTLTRIGSVTVPGAAGGEGIAAS